ncbi:ribonuclease H-like domain-containing protein [Tanacetum coccineum]
MRTICFSLSAIEEGLSYIVAHPIKDHDCWEKDMDTDRTVYTVHAPNAASDVPGEIKAALAASSIAFRQYQNVIMNEILQLISSMLLQKLIAEGIGDRPVVFVTDRGNTHDLSSFGEETDEITDLHQIVEDMLLTKREDGVAGIKRRRRDPSSDGVRDLVTAYTLVFQQHQDESIYDAWTRFKNLIQRVPHHGLDLYSFTQFFYDHVDDYTRMNLEFAADGNLREFSGEEAWEAIENFSQGQKEWDNPPTIISKQEDKVANLNPQSTSQVLPSFEENTLPVTYLDEVEEIIGIPIEVEPLDKTPLEDLGLNTCNHDIPLSSRKVPIFDELEPQP